MYEFVNSVLGWSAYKEKQVQKVATPINFEGFPSAGVLLKKMALSIVQ